MKPRTTQGYSIDEASAIIDALQKDIEIIGAITMKWPLHADYIADEVSRKRIEAKEAKKKEAK